METKEKIVKSHDIVVDEAWKVVRNEMLSDFVHSTEDLREAFQVDKERMKIVTAMIFKEWVTVNKSSLEFELFLRNSNSLNEFCFQIVFFERAHEKMRKLLDRSNY